MAEANGNNTPPVGQEAINTNIVTLTRFLTEEQSKHKEATGDFTCVLPLFFFLFFLFFLTNSTADVIHDG